MSSVNKIHLLGRVGKDPEVRRMQSGGAVVSFSLATTESWRSKDTGEKKENTTWHNVVVFNEHSGTVVEQYVRKGSRIYLEGKIQHREYTDKDGNKRNVTEVVLQKYQGELALLDSPKDSDSREPRRDPPAKESGLAPKGGTRTSDLDDAIPF